MKYAVKTLVITWFVVFATVVANEPTPTSLVQDQVGEFQSNTASDICDRESMTYEQVNIAKVVGLRDAIQLLTASKYPEAVTELQRHLGALELHLMQQKLDGKQKEIEKLKSELAELQNPLEPTQVDISLRVLQVSLTKLRDHKLDEQYASVLPNHKQNSVPRVVDDTKRIDELVDKLIAKDIATIITEPRILTFNGRQVSLQSGGEVPLVNEKGSSLMPQKFIPFGTMIKAMPLLQNGKPLRLMVSIELSEMDRSLGVTEGKITIPGFRRRQFSTGAELLSGQTLVMKGQRFDRIVSSRVGKITEDSVNEYENLVLIRPEYRSVSP